MNFISRFARTAAYITRLPLANLPKDDDVARMSGLSKYLPAVGLLIGALLLSENSVLTAVHADALLQGTLLAVTWLAITGGIHFDGLMDTADGIFSHSDRDHMLEIMTDSRVGNFGAMTGFCTLVLKVAALSTLPAWILPPALLLVPTWARWCESFAIGAFPYLRKSGMGKIWHDTTRYPLDVYLAGIVPLLATAGCQLYGWPPAAPIAIFTVLSGLSASYALNRILKGQTGDTYGASVELAETGALLCVALAAGVLGPPQPTDLL